MTRYKLIEIQDFYEFYNLLPKDDKGFINMKELLFKIAERRECSTLTVRYFLFRNFGNFEMRHGKIKPIKPQELGEQMAKEKEFTEWMEKKNKTLDYITRFLQTQTPSPIINTYLVRVSTSRDELKMGTDVKLQEMILDLKRDFNLDVKEE